MSLNQLEILGKIGERLRSSEDLGLLVNGRIFNQPKENGVLPFIRYGIDRSIDADTKTELGYLTDITIDAWSHHRGDKEILQITDVIKDLFHRAEFTGMTFQCVSISLGNSVTFIEPDGITTHAVLIFNAIFMET